MPAYLVVNATVTDMPRFKQYADRALPLIESFGGRRIALSRPTVLEGDAGWKGSAIYQWDSAEAARAFWHSDAYAALRTLRAGAAELEAILIEG